MKKIAIEEHAKEQDLEHLDQRLRDMDEAGVDMQVLSYDLVRTGGMSTSEVVSMTRHGNDALAGIVERYPSRFAGFAALALEEPEAAAVELERAVQQLGLKGALIFVGNAGEYLDEPPYQPVFETAAKLDVPIYMHPGALLSDMSKPYTVYPLLSGAAWGFSAATGLQAMRLICSGIFDKYPNLKIILGHMGEGIPFYLWRMNNHWVKGKEYGLVKADEPGGNLKKKPGDYFKENFYVTTSGMFWEPALQFINSVLGADRILFAVDYPPESAVEACQFIESVTMDDTDKEKICHLNAETLLRL